MLACRITLGMNKVSYSLYFTSLYFTLLYFTLLYFTSLYFTLLYFTLLYFTLLYFTLLYFTLICFTLLYFTLLYFTLLYFTLLYFLIGLVWFHGAKNANDCVITEECVNHNYVIKGSAMITGNDVALFSGQSTRK